MGDVKTTVADGKAEFRAIGFRPLDKDLGCIYFGTLIGEIPEEVLYLATDSDGKVYGYELMPVWIEELLSWDVEDGNEDEMPILICTFKEVHHPELSLMSLE